MLPKLLRRRTFLGGDMQFYSPLIGFLVSVKNHAGFSVVKILLVFGGLKTYDFNNQKSKTCLGVLLPRIFEAVEQSFSCFLQPLKNQISSAVLLTP